MHNNIDISAAPAEVIGLTPEEEVELNGLYDSYYLTECFSISNLRRMHVLEQKATEEQLRSMLGAHGQCYEEVFPNA
jgi:hypothetical protein